MKNSEILTKVKAFINTPQKWTQRSWARNLRGEDVPGLAPDAICFCAVTAFGLLGKGWHETSEAKQLLRNSILEFEGSRGIHLSSSIVEFNDKCEHWEMMEVFDKAIAAATRAEQIESETA